MIVRLHKRDIKELLDQQLGLILEDLEIGPDHPVAGLFAENLEELFANMLFKSKEMGDKYNIPNSVKEQEEEIMKARKEALEEFKETLKAKAKEDPLQKPDKAPAAEPIQVTPKELDTLMEVNPSDYARSLEGKD